MIQNAIKYLVENIYIHFYFSAMKQPNRQEYDGFTEFP